MCQWLSENRIDISKQGLDFRFTKSAVKFMQAMYLESINLFKNSLQLDCVVHEVAVELYAKLCIVLIFHGISNCIKLKKNAELSLTKSYIYLKRWAIEFFIVLGQSVKKIQAFLKKLADARSKFALKDTCTKEKHQPYNL